MNGGNSDNTGSWGWDGTTEEGNDGSFRVMREGH